MSPAFSPLADRTTVTPSKPRLLLILIYALMLCACEQQPAPPSASLSTVIAKTAASIVAVELDGHTVGSAFAVGGEGLFLTNAHIVKHGKPYLRTEAELTKAATVVRVHPEEDIALLRADLTLPALAMSSKPLLLGEPVVALGNPFGLGITATQGIISAQPKSIGKRFLLQTDAAINPGNSGGPLIDRQGEVVGLISSRGSIGSGVGFAIPASLIENFLEELP